MKTRWNSVPHKNWTHAREMREMPSSPERLLWNALKNHAAGVHFRRQHPIGKYIVDFCSLRHKIIVEVDGIMHVSEDARESDAVRDEFLREQGFAVIRVTTVEVMENLDKILTTIRAALQKQPESSPKAL